MEGSGRRGSFLRSSKPGMAYPVNVTVRAERDLALLFESTNAGRSSSAF